MLFLDDSTYLFRVRDHYKLNDYLKHHLMFINQFQYNQPDFILNACNYLVEQLKIHGKRSSAYDNICGIVDKSHLNKNWYIDGYNAQTTSTSGTTTGERFQYLRWADTYQAIEADCHYKAVLKEFNLDRPISILYLMLDQSDERSNTELIKTYRTNNILISHGQSEQALVYEVVRNKTYYNNYFEFYERIFEFCQNNPIDVIIAPGQALSALVWNAKRLKLTRKICKLFSNTGEKANPSDFEFLKTNGLIDNWCDHMRCWDGGITFMTCKHHQYHILDGLAWVYSSDDKLVSTDFYSLPSPFINYWNGDYGRIATEYTQCHCGRYYREFNLSRTRGFSFHGQHNNQMRSLITSTGIDITVIKRAEASGSFIRIFTTKSVSASCRSDIRKRFPNLEVNFVTEEEHG